MTYYNRVMTIKEFDNQTKEYNKVKVACKCGYRTIFPYWVDKKVCSWCHNYVYRTKKIEFEEKLKNARKNIQ